MQNCFLKIDIYSLPLQSREIILRFSNVSTCGKSGSYETQQCLITLSIKQMYSHSFENKKKCRTALPVVQSSNVAQRIQLTIINVFRHFQTCGKNQLKMCVIFCNLINQVCKQNLIANIHHREFREYRGKVSAVFVLHTGITEQSG